MMNVRKIYCANDSNYHQYYENQLGRGFGDIRVFRGPRFQRGYGFAKLIGRLAAPLFRYLGKEVLSSGIELGNRVIKNPDVQSTLREGVKELAEQGLKKLKSKMVKIQTGKGRRRLYKRKSRRGLQGKSIRSKKVTKKKPKKSKGRKIRRRKLKDIFG